MTPFQSPVVDVYLTGACNLACDYCFGEVDSRPGMDRNTFARALSMAKHAAAEAVEFCGGEPLMYKDFSWAVQEAQKEGFRLILRTNGLLVKRYRSLIAKNFQAIGISLDGDPSHNERMRPMKGKSKLTAQQKFEIPLSEILELKRLNPGLQVVLASVATSENLEGLRNLARILGERRLPIDMWKVYQFVPNYFRSLDNRTRFEISPGTFNALSADLKSTVAGQFELRCRSAAEVDGSCLIVGQSGDVLVGGKAFGNVLLDDAQTLLLNLGDRVQAHINTNKLITYARILKSSKLGPAAG
jgi:MoaA/NifB/PqqE/SkfB family radical SAM enzyme